MEISLVVWSALSVVAGYVGGSRGGSAAGFFPLALVLSPLVGLIAPLGMPTIERTPAGEIVRRRPCPTCAEAILPEAATCRYCGSDVSPAQTYGSGKIEPPTE